MSEVINYKKRSAFHEFCEETTLNGWYYMAKKNITRYSRFYWMGVIMSSLLGAFALCYGIVVEFLDSNVIITVQSVSASLDEVTFPSLVICNQDQVLFLFHLSD